MRRRLDAELVRRELVPSRSAAQDLISAGKVLVSGSVALKSARLVDPAESVTVLAERPRFVGRGGEKLDAALQEFHLDPSGFRVLDAGASTGGFTDCLLQAGAREVTALDVGHGQLHESLRGDDRVHVVERTNLRFVTTSDFGEFDAVVADLSFISLRTVMPNLAACARRGAWIVVLVKPQFEAGRAEVSRGRGIVSDPELWRGALDGVASAAAAEGLDVCGAAVSPIRGGDGNVEFLLHLLRPERAPDVPSGALANTPSVASLLQRVVDSVPVAAEERRTEVSS
ncbi:MAG: TlyA family RNA methyltransferase [Actinomycetes bacterium]